MRRATALALAPAAAAAAVLLLLAAFDVQRWQERLAEGDVRFGTAPAAPKLWQAPTLLPGDPARRLLGLGDDLRYRDGVQAFFASHPRTTSYLHPELEPARAQAQVKLRNIAEVEANDRRRSEVANFLGVLAAAGAPRQEQARRTDSLEAAAASYTDAIRFDRSNEDAMFNLEAVLRRLLDEPPAYESRGSRRPRDEASMGGLRDPGSGY